MQPGVSLINTKGQWNSGRRTDKPFLQSRVAKLFF